jgi:hypothetical protein
VLSPTTLIWSTFKGDWRGECGPASNLRRLQCVEGVVPRCFVGEGKVFHNIQKKRKSAGLLNSAEYVASAIGCIELGR